MGIVSFHRFLLLPGSGCYGFFSLGGELGFLSFQRFQYGGKIPVAQCTCIFLQQRPILIHFAPIQPHNRIQILELPLTPLVQGAVHHGVIVPSIDEQHLVPQFLLFPFVEKPQGTGQTLGVEKLFPTEIITST